MRAGFNPLLTRTPSKMLQEDFNVKDVKNHKDSVVLLSSFKNNEVVLFENGESMTDMGRIASQICNKMLISLNLTS